MLVATDNESRGRRFCIFRFRSDMRAIDGGRKRRFCRRGRGICRRVVKHYIFARLFLPCHADGLKWTNKQDDRYIVRFAVENRQGRLAFHGFSVRAQS